MNKIALGSSMLWRETGVNTKRKKNRCEVEEEDACVCR